MSEEVVLACLIITCRRLVPMWMAWVRTGAVKRVFSSETPPAKALWDRSGALALAMSTPLSQTAMPSSYRPLSRPPSTASVTVNSCMK